MTILRRLVCWFRGHDVEAFESSTAIDGDVRHYSFRCRRCRKVWPRALGFTHSLLRSGWKVDLVHALDEKCRKLSRS